MNLLDSIIMQISPTRGLTRVRARMASQLFSRHFEAAEQSRRTQHWRRPSTDANSANLIAIHHLRNLARDLVRNDGWARNGLGIVANSAVGWGIVPVLKDDRFAKVWAEWVRQCDADGRHSFYSMQRLVMKAMAQDGEVLIRRRARRVADGLPLPLQLEVIEADFLDHNKTEAARVDGNKIIQGVEFDKIGRRVAYHLFVSHPGDSRGDWGRSQETRRIPADEIIHLYRVDRPGQIRGVSWFAPAILTLKDFDEYADATLMKQKIAACFAAFVTDTQGASGHLGEKDDDDPLSDTLEPGMLVTLPPGKDVEFGTPPATTDHESFSRSQLRKIAAGLGITYESLTGDYSNVNYSSGRLGRLTFASNILEWQYDLLIPHFCERVWSWVQDAAVAVGSVSAAMATDWTPPPLPMVDPDKDTKASMAAVRAGLMTPSEMVRAQGYDPRVFWNQYSADLKTLDKLGIVLDSDPRQRTQSGQAQSVAAPPSDPPAKRSVE